MSEISRTYKNLANGSTMKKYQSIIITLLQTVISIGVAFMITLIGCKFDIKQFNWVVFIMSFLLSTYMKIIYTEYQKGKEMQNENITTLENTITYDKKIIYDHEKTHQFEEELATLNKISKLDAYISIIDNIPEKKKTQYFKESRRWAFNYKKALEEGKDVVEFEQERSILSLKWVKYGPFPWQWEKIHFETVTMAKLFAFGKNSKKYGKKYSFSAANSSLSRAVIPMTFSVVFSLIYGLIAPDPSATFSWTLMMQLISYLSSISMGIWWGISNGRAIIQEDYAEVLNNVAALVREIRAKIIPKDQV